MRRVLHLLLLLVAANVSAAEDRGLAWKLQSGNATVVLLGSIHYADDSFYPLRKDIEQAFEQADTLVVEVNMDEAAGYELRKLTHRDGLYRGRETIRDHISQDTYARLLAQLQKLDIPYTMIERQKPGILVLTLTSVQLMKQGFMPDHGIDAYFMRRARDQHKRVLELESLTQQFDLILNLEAGDLLLQETLTGFDEIDATMQSLVESWKQGDETKLSAVLFEDMLQQYPAYADVYEALFYTRNIGMAATIEHYLETGGHYFVVIGAGHLVGDKSIISLLESKGYKAGRF
jgi:uncharacterized protein YbaP (TraB family)